MENVEQKEIRQRTQVGQDLISENRKMWERKVQNK